MDALEYSMIDGMNQIKNQLTSKKIVKEVQIVNDVSSIHFAITCNICKVKNFKGRRFKCLICHDFDICDRCEVKNLHKHPLIRFVHPPSLKRENDFWDEV